MAIFQLFQKTDSDGRTGEVSAQRQESGDLLGFALRSVASTSAGRWYVTLQHDGIPESMQISLLFKDEESGELFSTVSPFLASTMADSSVAPRGRQGCAEALGIGAFIVVKDVMVDYS